MSYEEQTRLDKTFHALVEEFIRSNSMYMSDSSDPRAWRLESRVSEKTHILVYRDARSAAWADPFDFTATVVWDTEQNEVVWGDVTITFETKPAVTQEQGAKMAEDKLADILQWHTDIKKKPARVQVPAEESNVTKMVQGELLGYARELGCMFIRNNWRVLRDTTGVLVSIENWGLEFNNCEGDKEKFIYRSPRKEGVQVKDFVLTFDLVVGDYEKLDLQGEASLGEATAIMKGILEFVHTLPKEKERMTDKSFDEEVTEHRKNEIKKLDNCIADMSLQDIIAWLGTYWGRKPGDGQGNFAIVTSRNTTTFHDGDLDHAREVILAHLSRLGKRDVSEPNPQKESQMTAMLKGMNDKDLAIWFRNFQFNVGENYLVLRSVANTTINFEVPYWPAFGREIAARLEVPRVTEDMLVIDLGKERPINPLNAVKRFTIAIDKFIQEGPEEPELRAYGTERQIAQGWIDWYRKTHACGFDVAWTEGARRLIEKEYANRPEELKKITWYPRPHNPLFIEIGTKLEFIQQ